jgi:predicted nucleotidyltransferase
VGDDPVLRRFRGEVEKLFPGRVEQVILYGSRARGEAGPQSDYDLAVVLREYSGGWSEIDRLADLQWDLLVELGADLSALPFSRHDFEHASALVSEIKRDGILP